MRAFSWIRIGAIVTASTVVALAAPTSGRADVTEKLELSAAAFQQTSGDADAHHGYFLTGAGHFLARLDLPANATVTRLTGYADDQATGAFQNMSLSLYKARPSAFTQTLMAQVASVDGIIGVQSPTTTNISAALVGAGNAVYLELILPSTVQPIYFTGAKVVYTVPPLLTPTR
ncbi:MAG TPA: hypothetical protein VFD92_22940 [Candidatus Binatia bacterium]|nr:hypothetical protein [Candidatus Binatia bacterium]